ncbi:helix-turn-helix domain-containing protein [Paenibacillus dakarensis]|uniref:helix-turn-helix domain-containing protein n=1 Tax=Paenibacillus dakarensis TaxID=1527293 RepID=UPI0006D5312B|nr:helix-turn-helix transcriptional regulator [Paenibacillus dakarensis]
MSTKLLGEFIQQKRSEKEMSLRDLAESAEISPSQLSKLERGLVKHPNSDSIVRIAYALNVDKDDLLALAGIINIENVITHDKVYDFSEIILQSLRETSVAYEEASLLEQFKDIVEYRNQDLDGSDILFIAKEIEAAYELGLRRVRSKKRLEGIKQQDWNVEFDDGKEG